MTTTVNGDTGVSAVQPGAVESLDLPAGTILQVISGSTSSQVANGASAFADTGLTATITPKSATSNILVIVNQNGVQKNTGDASLSVGLRLMRNATNIATFATTLLQTSTALLQTGAAGVTVLDSPNTTSPVVYKTQFSSTPNFGTVYVQAGSGVVSTITLMEVAA